LDAPHGDDVLVHQIAKGEKILIGRGRAPGFCEVAQRDQPLQLIVERPLASATGQVMPNRNLHMPFNATDRWPIGTICSQGPVEG
jgi:hypothetical protein